MHCASCEILIEKKLIKEDTVEMVDVSLAKGTVVVEYHSDKKITPEYLNTLFKEDHYRFSATPFKSKTKIAADSHCAIPNEEPTNPYTPLLIAGVFIVGYIFLSKTGFSSLISVNAQSSLPVFLLFGLLAGFSSCAALTGGIILSLSKQWNSLYSNSDSTMEKLEPHFLFNTGRLVSYIIFGAVLGQLGNFFRMTPVLTAGIVVAVSVLMVILGLQMLGVKALSKFQLRLPKSLTSNIADESNFQGKYAPFIMGALTFLLPCGFTITVQALALASGNPIQGALMMGLFALGTLPGLFAIGLSSVKLFSNPKISRQFSTIAGLLVLFFALFNVNSQMAVLGFSNFNDIITTSKNTITVAGSQDSFVPIENGKQIIKMEASSFGYTPNRFKVKVGVPVRWEIADTGTSGCTNAIISRGLFEGQIDLVNGTTSVKEFTIDKPGTYKFSCWMGMVSGTIEAVDGSQNSLTTNQPAPTVVESGAKGCGCGGGGAAGSGSCGGR